MVTPELKEMKKFSFFIRGVARIIAGQRRLTKIGHKLLLGPHNGFREGKILKFDFENVSKIDYIILVSGHLKDIGYSLIPNIEK